MNIKKIAFSLVIALFTVTIAAFAQDDPNKAYKSANTSLVKYNNNQDVEMLEESKTQIDFAIENIEGIVEKKVVRAYNKKGEVYLALAKDQTTKVKYEDALDVAYEAYKTAITNESAKKFEK